MIHNKFLQVFISHYPKLLKPVSVLTDNTILNGFTFYNNPSSILDRGIIGIHEKYFIDVSRYINEVNDSAYSFKALADKSLYLPRVKNIFQKWRTFVAFRGKV